MWRVYDGGALVGLFELTDYQRHVDLVVRDTWVVVRLHTPVNVK